MRLSLSSLVALAVSVLLPVNSMAQTGSVSPKYSFNITKVPSASKPPILSVDTRSIEFIDPSANNAIDAGEQVRIRFDVENTGFGPGSNCFAKVRLTGTTAGITASDVRIPVIPVGQKVSVTVPVTAGLDIQNGLLAVNIEVIEPNGFGVDPFPVEVTTKAFQSPLLKITDYAVTGTSRTLQRKTPFDLQLLLQNVEYGTAQDIEVSVSLPDGVVVIDGEQHQKFSTLAPGDAKSIDLSLIANNNYVQSSIPVRVSIREKYGKYSENRVIDLAFDQSLSSGKISIEATPDGPKEAIQIASLGSDVDKVPASGRVEKNTFAIIVANEHYQNDAVVDYAIHDGTVFKEYCNKTLGIPEDNIQLLTDATLNNIRSAVTYAQDVAKAFKGKSRLIFYYAGHGLPDDATRSAYILPVDGDGRNPKTSGLSLDELYKDLALCQTESTLVLMDACFSGARRDGGMLNSARSVVMAPEETDPYGNIVVLSAASGEQTAFKFDEQKHGMFTYFLLKALKDTKGNVNLGTLSDYIIDNVSQKSIVLNHKSQTPSVLTGKAVADWKNIKL